MNDHVNRSPGNSGRRAVWAAGLVVATGAGVATAHGLYQVATSARVPTPIAWLYPLITDGLALVAYAATSRLAHGGRRYAAAIVVLAAGLSGLAQATYLTGGLSSTGSGSTAPAVLRFGVGAWPAIAAALTAHLLHLIGSAPAVKDAPLTRTRQQQPTEPAYNAPSVQSYGPAYNPAAVQPSRSTVGLDETAVQPARSTAPDSEDTARTDAEQSGSTGGASPAKDRARVAARSHYARHGNLPTASELMQLAQVARGTAGAVLKDLRNNRPALHVVNADPEQENDKLPAHQRLDQ
jgi:hypothetical protein